MNRGTPSIACIGIIGRHVTYLISHPFVLQPLTQPLAQDNPLHITAFPAPSTPHAPLHLQLLLNSSLDIFEARLPSKPASHDFGLLQAVDERLAMYGWLTNTGVKFVVVVDMEGRPAGTAAQGDRGNALLGIRDADLRPVFRAVQRAYVGVLRNPFYDPDARGVGDGDGGVQIKSLRFGKEMRRIGEAWYPGVTSL